MVAAGAGFGEICSQLLDKGASMETQDKVIARNGLKVTFFLNITLI
jgi:hypothetical protein